MNTSAATLHRITLPQDCDRAAAAAILPELLAGSGQVPLEIDGTAVVRIGQAMLQVLLAARRAGAGALITPSDALRETAQLTGLEQALFDLEAA